MPTLSDFVSAVITCCFLFVSSTFASVIGLSHPDWWLIVCGIVYTNCRIDRAGRVGNGEQD